MDFMENEIVLENESKDYCLAILTYIRSELSDNELKEALEKFHDNDIASVIDELTHEEKERVKHGIK